MKEFVSWKKENANCPLCGSADICALQTFQTDDLVRRWHELFQINIQEEFSGLLSFALWRCPRCALHFFSPPAIGSPRLYESLQQFDWYYVAGKWEYSEALRDIAGCKSVLEVGSGFGDFVKLARDSLGVQNKGFEYNRAAIKEARDRGIHLENADLAEIARDSAGTFDAVCSFQVLEHVPHPKEFLQHCCDLLVPSGRLILGLPNARSFLRLQSNLLDLPPHHFSRWSVRTIKFLPNLFPLRLRRLALEPLAESQVTSYVEAHTDRLAHGALFFANHPWLQSRLSRLLIRTGLRSHLLGMTIYAVFEKV